ncbi:pimeloyl-ACP methyl ester carboxylesterase [Kineococcus radiotolerans]|uniref:Pimeloyl-ACP methyl ester carboxylesterase n=1 Tax=Kineococcus radiotolerans TaxID=131568 RepID=A0A7W4TJG3_KINRA|nr:alpha/beta hydrolase [Kineococcus radiotolerans]MBB2900008.1 pimeloyl-ACP methyl ester carboxylesterase [Kineococcus radiotolerans]
MPRHRPAVLAAASALALAGPLLLSVSPAAAAPAPAAVPLSGQRPATVEEAQRQFEARTPQRYRDQDLAWSPCSSAQIGLLNSLVVGLECARVAVPRDWDAPEEGEPLQVTISRLPQAGPRPERTIVTNPGGPGGAGLTLATLPSMAPALAGTEVIGLDVRGTGASSSLTCGDDLLAAASAAPDYRDRSPEALALAAESVRAGAEACADDPLADVVNTRQTVFDVDLVRDALDRDTIDWVGYSGGTWLGTQFATHLPGRVGRFVLDSTVDATAGYQEVFSYQPMAFQRRFEQDFAPWVAAGNAAYGLGATGEEVTATYERLRASLAARPIGVPGLTVDGTLLDSLVLQAMYGKAQFPQAAWLLSAVQVVDALRGGGVPVPAGLSARVGDLARALSPVEPSAAGKQQATFAATTCGDSAWTRDQAYWDALGDEQGARYPLLGYAQSQQVCAYWDRPDLTLPVVDGADLPPLLIVQSRHDPATAYEGAVRTHEALGSSVMITVEDEGDHGLYGAGNACVDDAVSTFLTTGAAPAQDLTCRGTGLPPVAGGGAESLLAKVLRTARGAASV